MYLVDFPSLFLWESLAQGLSILPANFSYIWTGKKFKNWQIKQPLPPLYPFLMPPGGADLSLYLSR